MKFIRDQQEKNYQNLVTSRENNKDSAPEKTPSTNFEESLQYFSDLQTKPTCNKTVRNMNSGNKSHNLPAMKIPVSEPTISTTNFDQHVNQEPVILNKPVQQNVKPSPSWGCMKNGSLPTYRNWKQNTQKVGIDTDLGGQEQQTTYDKPIKVYTPEETKRAEIKAMVAAKQKQDGGGSKQPKLRYQKQKKTVRRTYNVGRSKVFSKVGVLVSNKTMRNNISTKAQLLKQTPIDEIRRELIKTGFIRVGSNAPNDVLRQLYETSKMICGEVHNHNTENLLYNYINER